MNFLSSLSSAVISASSAALSNATSQIPGVSGYTLGDKVLDYQGKSIWTLYHGIKRDDQSKVSIFSYEVNNSPGGGDRKQLLNFAKNSFRKLRSTRHPNVLKFLDGSESDHSVWIITEPVTPLSTSLEGMSLESKIFGLLHLTTALTFLNKSTPSEKGAVHGGLRLDSGVWVTKGGDWKLGGFELTSKLEDQDGVLWSNSTSALPNDNRYYSSPEIRKGGYTSLKQLDPESSFDSWLLHLFIFQLFSNNNDHYNNLPSSYLSTPLNEPASLPMSSRGQIPPNLFQAWKRLGSQNPTARLKTSQFLEMGNSTSDGWWTNNRLVRLSTALENFSLSSENEQVTLIRTLKAISSSNSTSTTQSNGSSTSSSTPLPTGFLLYKILPSLLHTFEFSSSSTSSSSLLPLILSLSTPLPSPEYSQLVIPAILRMFQLPDRSIRMALLEGLDQYVENLTSKQVVEKIWPNLLTGFGDLVPVIREVTVKSILSLAPKLNDRILNNDLLRYLSKTQTDSEPGIRTNTCILLSRLSPFLSCTTRSKVLIPAFARSLRDPFVHARIAGLMSLMAGLESWDKEDLAGKVIPSVGITLVDKEKIVRDQGFKAIEMFVRKCEQLTASMPETALPPSTTNSTDSTPSTPSLTSSVPSVGLATNAAGAAGVLAGWAFGGVGKKLSTAELAAPIERRVSTPTLPPSTISTPIPQQFSSSGSGLNSVPGGFAFEEPKEDWGGDLMDVNDDTEDWDEFETGQQQQQPPRKPITQKIDPLAARLASKSKSSPLGGAGGNRRAGGGGGGGGGALKLGAASKSSALRLPMDMDATDSWDLDLNDEEQPVVTTVPKTVIKPKLTPASSLSLSLSSTTTTNTATPSSTRPSRTIPSSISKPQPLHSRTTSTSSSSSSSRQPVPVPPPNHIPPPIIIPPRSSTSPPPREKDDISPAPSNPWEDQRSPLPPLSTPPLAPIPPSTSTVPTPPIVPPTPTTIDPPFISSTESSSGTILSEDVITRSSSPALSTTTATTTGLSKEEKAAKMAAAREERRKRMAAAKAGK